MTVEIQISKTTSELTQSAAEAVAERLNQAIVTKSRARLVLTGGTLGIQILTDLANLPLDLERLDVFWGDERFVGLDHPDRNEAQALEAWKELGNAKLFRFPAPNQELDSAALEMNLLIQDEFGELDTPASVFDVLILGMGPDGHIASLFPGHTQPNTWVIAEKNSPKPPAERLSFSYQALNRADHVVFLASGESKAEAIGCALQDLECQLPAAKVQGLKTTTWFLDEEVSRGL
jgi:6-phosphogluconolactonase